MRLIIVNFHGLRLDTRILVISLICILYLPSLTLYDLVLLLCCFVLLRDLVLLLYCFAHLYLMRHGCHMWSLDFPVHLVEKILYYEHLSMFLVDQSFYRLECLKCLKYLKYLKHFEYSEHLKHFEYLKYFQSRLVYLIFRPLNPDFCFA